MAQAAAQAAKALQMQLGSTGKVASAAASEVQKRILESARTAAETARDPSRVLASTSAAAPAAVNPRFAHLPEATQRALAAAAAKASEVEARANAERAEAEKAALAALAGPSHNQARSPEITRDHARPTIAA